ncbi:MAG: 50S ribosomal protein L3 N(5)-glutamine methyltransferase [Acidiferrobacterales bacterium]
MNVSDLINSTAEKFNEAGLYFGHGTLDAVDEAAWLMSKVLNVEPEKLSEYSDQQLTADQLKMFEKIAARRIATRKPLAYLVNEAWFCGMKFYVDERVIVPRSLIGEFIQEEFQPWLGDRQPKRILDLCTGSGCIAIALARQFPHANIDAVDLSSDALEVARINIERHQLQQRVNAIQSDLFDELDNQQYDLIVSNPPYVHPDSMHDLPAEYLHEPEMALVAEEGGLALIDRILLQAPDHLAENGLLIVEVGESQSAVMEKYSSLPLVWLSHSSGEDSVFLLEKRDFS